MRVCGPLLLIAMSFLAAACNAAPPPARQPVSTPAPAGAAITPQAVFDTAIPPSPTPVIDAPATLTAAKATVEAGAQSTAGLMRDYFQQTYGDSGFSWYKSLTGIAVKDMQIQITTSLPNTEIGRGDAGSVCDVASAFTLKHPDLLPDVQRLVVYGQGGQELVSADPTALFGCHS